ncbi:MAG: alpha/beta hydrolase [Ruminococcaceae bacterium]|nr:alpha/beta hydrolase [Oscillospiraceae bacterium]
MKILKNEFSFRSSNNINTVRGIKVYDEDCQHKAVMVISHGMVEHYDRYVDFMEYLAGHGFKVYMHDHIGHKHSVDSDDQLGYFAAENGYIHALGDLLTVVNMAKEENPDLKVFLLGHSMGSFFARAFAAAHGELIDGLLISGTGGPNKAAGGAIKLIKAMKLFKGDKHRSHYMQNIAFGKYLEKIENPDTPSDWITRDKEIVQQYVNDKYCQFVFTLNGFEALMEIIALSGSDETFVNTPKDLPVFIFSGSMDPVGNYGIGVMQVVDCYKDAGCTDVQVKIYDGGRHEMLNEINRDEVYTDVLNWLVSKVED